MEFRSASEMDGVVSKVLRIEGGRATVLDEGALSGGVIDRLVWTAALGGAGLKERACETIQAAAAACGCPPASMHRFYMAVGRKGIGGRFTVPAINIRGMTYDTARAIFRTARKKGAGAFIFEIARSEIGYTEQRPAEYSAVVLGAAIREGHRCPVFIQGDHFQVSRKKFAEDPGKEVGAVRGLIKEAVAANFLNIDIDTSTLVDLERPTVREQQRQNGRIAAELTALIREIEPAGVTISVGGEIGEVGKKNSTADELRAFVAEYDAALGGLGKDLVGLSKISVQTGTTHGGVVLPDGTIAQVQLDFDTLGSLSGIAREEFGMSGAVQHGASTLPEELFNKFPEVGAAEIHLATGFQNIVYDHERMPAGLRDRVYDHLREKCAAERKAGDTDEQFLYKTRKKGFGPFKREFWSLPADVKGPICEALEARFDFLFDKLGVGGTLGKAAELALVRR